MASNFETFAAQYNDTLTGSMQGREITQREEAEALFSEEDNTGVMDNLTAGLYRGSGMVSQALSNVLSMDDHAMRLLDGTFGTDVAKYYNGLKNLSVATKYQHKGIDILSNYFSSDAKLAEKVAKEMGGKGFTNEMLQATGMLPAQLAYYGAAIGMGGTSTIGNVLAMGSAEALNDMHKSKDLIDLGFDFVRGSATGFMMKPINAISNPWAMSAAAGSQEGADFIGNSMYDVGMDNIQWGQLPVAMMMGMGLQGMKGLQYAAEDGKAQIGKQARAVEKWLQRKQEGSVYTKMFNQELTQLQAQEAQLDLGLAKQEAELAKIINRYDIDDVSGLIESFRLEANSRQAVETAKIMDQEPARQHTSYLKKNANPKHIRDMKFVKGADDRAKALDLLKQIETSVAAGAAFQSGIVGVHVEADARKMAQEMSKTSFLSPDEQFYHTFGYIRQRPTVDTALVAMDAEGHILQTQGRLALPVVQPSTRIASDIKMLRELAMKTAEKLVVKDGVSIEKVQEHPAMARFTERLKLRQQLFEKHSKERYPTMFDTIFKQDVDDKGKVTTLPLFADVDTKFLHSFMTMTALSDTHLETNPLLRMGADAMVQRSQAGDTRAKAILYGPETKGPITPGTHPTSKGAITNYLDLHTDQRANVVRALNALDKSGQAAARNKGALREIDDKFMKEFGLDNVSARSLSSIRNGFSQIHDQYVQLMRNIDPHLTDFPTPMQLLYSMRTHMSPHKVVIRVEGIKKMSKSGKRIATQRETYAMIPARNPKHAQNLINGPLKEAAARLTKETGRVHTVDPKIITTNMNKHTPAMAMESIIDRFRAEGFTNMADKAEAMSQSTDGVASHSIARVEDYVRGFLGDDVSDLGINTSNAKIDAEFTDSFTNYITGMSMAMSKIESKIELAPLFDVKGEFREHYPNAVRYLENHFKNTFGDVGKGTEVTRNAVVALSDSIVGALEGSSTNKFKDAVLPNTKGTMVEGAISNVNRIVIKNALGTVGFLVAMPTQFISVPFPNLLRMKHVSKIDGDIGKSTLQALDDMINPTKEIQDLKEWAAQNGVLAPNYSNDQVGSHAVSQHTDGMDFASNYKNKSWKQIGKDLAGKVYDYATINPVIQSTEQYTRWHTYLTTYNFLRSAGYSKEYAKRNSVRPTDVGMVEYNRGGKMNYLQEFGLNQKSNRITSTGAISTTMQVAHINRMAGTFKTYLGNWLGHMATHLENSKDFRNDPARAIPLATFIALSSLGAGVGGFVGMGIYDKMVNFLQSFFGMESIPNSSQLLTMRTETGEKMLPDYLVFGIPSATLGIDISGTLGAPTLDPVQDLGSSSFVDFTLATGKIALYNTWDLFEEGPDTNYGRLSQNWKKVTPKVLHGAIESYYTRRQYGKSKRSDSMGIEQIMRTDVATVQWNGDKGQPYVRSEMDWWKRMLTGKKSLEEARALNDIRTVFQLKSVDANLYSTKVQQATITLANTGKIPAWIMESVPPRKRVALWKAARKKLIDASMSHRDRQRTKLSNYQDEAIRRYYLNP